MDGGYWSWPPRHLPTFIFHSPTAFIHSQVKTHSTITKNLFPFCCQSLCFLRQYYYLTLISLFLPCFPAQSFFVVTSSQAKRPAGTVEILPKQSTSTQHLHNVVLLQHSAPSPIDIVSLVFLTWSSWRPITESSSIIQFPELAPPVPRCQKHEGTHREPSRFCLPLAI